MDCLVGIDVGSTSMKALIYDPDGNVLSQASAPQESVAQDSAHPGWQVYLPEQIWGGIASAIHQAVDNLRPDMHIRAAAVTGLGADAVPLDEKGEPLYPFINWLCTRTTPQYEWWLDHVGLEKTFQITGWQPFVWSTVLRFMWLKENEPELAKQVRQWLIVEDYVNYRLTGKYSTDFTDASPTLLLDQKKLDWSDELLQVAGLERELFPKPQQSGSYIGDVTPEASQKTGLPVGTPIFQGGHDYLIGALAANIIEPGRILDVTGTWELVLTPTKTLNLDEDLRKMGLTIEAHAAPDTYCIWGGGTAANMMEWYKDLYSTAEMHSGSGSVWQHLMKEADNSPAGANGIFFLPHFNGTTCPTLDPRSLGAFLGLNDTTSRSDMIRAVVEGLDYAFVDMLRALEKGSGRKADVITAIGGAVRNEFWMQNKADTSGCVIETPQLEEATALGAAMLAGVGVGIYADLEEAAQRVSRPGRRFEPNPELVPVYAELFEIYKEIQPALSGVNNRIYDRFRI